MYRTIRRASPLILITAIAGCADMDLDLRNNLGNSFDTSTAARAAIGLRPLPDKSGVLSYPNYQVAVAQKGDTVTTVANRLGLDAATLAKHNGIDPDAPLNEGETLSLPDNAIPAGTTLGEGEVLTPTVVDISELSSNPAQAAKTVNTAEPARHRVLAGETLFSLGRLYDMPVSSIAEWNGLPADAMLREGQVLLIPVAREGFETPTVLAKPGEGTATPTPPSSLRPQPRDTATAATAATTAAAKPVADLGRTTAASASAAKFVTPVAGSIIRDYSKGKNEGVDIGAPAGTPVKAADKGVVAAVTKDTNGVSILVIKHAGNVLTVYTNIDSLSVKKGDSVSRGQTVAKVKAGQPSFLHFEVRDGLDSVDPNNYI